MTDFFSLSVNPYKLPEPLPESPSHGEENRPESSPSKDELLVRLNRKERLRRCKMLRLATFNARTLNKDRMERVGELTKHMQRNIIDACACQETNQKSKGAPKVEGYRWLGKGNVGFMISLALSKVVQDIGCKSNSC
jgi:hypothetical protein